MTPDSSGMPPKAVQVVIRGVIRQLFSRKVHRVIYQDIVKKRAV
jgi:hypothetical protein